VTTAHVADADDAKADVHVGHATGEDFCCASERSTNVPQRIMSR